MNVLGIDIGGTAIKSDLYTETGTSQNQFREMATRINHEGETNAILQQVLQLIAEYVREHNVDGVAISSAGVIDPVKGEVVYSGYTIPGYTGTNFKQAIESQFGIRCTVENDVNCAALGEYWLGAARGCQSLICLTIGTGIGGAILLNGKTWYGNSYSAGEVGYLKVRGKNWQDLASTTALCAYYEKVAGLKEVDGKRVMQDYRQGKAEAIQAVDYFVGNFCEGLLSLNYLFNPECIILGGGIMKQSDILLSAIEREMQEQVEDSYFLPTQIVSAQLGNAAGRIGAVYKFLKERALVSL